MSQSALTNVAGFAFASIAAGPDYSLGVTQAGRLYAWGNTEWNILTQSQTSSPLQVGVDADWLAVSAGHRHGLAMKTDRSLWAWGNNQFGQLGTNNNTSRSAPIQIMSNTLAFSAGGFHSLILDDSQNLYSFGRNSEGQLGLGDLSDRLQATPISIPNEVVISIDAGPFTNSVITHSGNVYHWGKIGGNILSVPTLIFPAE